MGIILFLIIVIPMVIILILVEFYFKNKSENSTQLPLEFEFIEYKKNGSCIDIFDFEDNLLIRITPHYDMNADNKKINDDQAREISMIALNFEFYYNNLL